MPTYDYRCEACGHAFEHFQSMTSRRLRKCPACGKPKLERLVGSGAGVIFKGSGFYETDYKRAGQKAPSEPKPESASATKDSSSGAGDASSASSSASGSGGSDGGKTAKD